MRISKKAIAWLAGGLAGLLIPFLMILAIIGLLSLVGCGENSDPEWVSLPIWQEAEGQIGTIMEQNCPPEGLAWDDEREFVEIGENYRIKCFRLGIWKRDEPIFVPDPPVVELALHAEDGEWLGSKVYEVDNGVITAWRPHHQTVDRSMWRPYP